MQGQQESTSGSQGSLLIVGGFGAVLVALGGLIVASPSGLFGFLQSVEQADPLSISTLVSFVGIVFILLHRLGMTFGAAEQIEHNRDLSST